MIYVANIREKVEGISLDITVKNNPTHFLSPTWSLVRGFKMGQLNWETYKKQYINLVLHRWYDTPSPFIELINLSHNRDIYLKCFCTDENLCHRKLAQKILILLDEKLSYKEKTWDT